MEVQDKAMSGRLARQARIPRAAKCLLVTTRRGWDNEWLEQQVAKTFLWFDIGYTLLYKPREQACHDVLAELGHDIPIDRLGREYHLVDKLFMRERPGVFGHDPETFMPWFLGELNYRLDIRVDIARAWVRLKALQPGGDCKWLPFDHVPEALAGLRERSYRLGVISNWDPSAPAILI
jgi:putative hydrolase of the HAD superfamily